MKRTAFILLGFAAAFCFGFAFGPIFTQETGGMHAAAPHTKTEKEDRMKLGTFSISLSVRDIHASRAFYEQLGFTVFAGGLEQNYLIMKNGNALIGLFEGMFEGNILTFNPGWDENARNVEDFDDVREIQRHLKSKGVALLSEADEDSSGPASLMVTDPDGNVVLIDQHR